MLEWGPLLSMNARAILVLRLPLASLADLLSVKVVKVADGHTVTVLGGETSLIAGKDYYKRDRYGG